MTVNSVYWKTNLVRNDGSNERWVQDNGRARATEAKRGPPNRLGGVHLT